LSLDDPVMAQLLAPVDTAMARVAKIRDVDPAPVLDLLESARRATTDAAAVLAAPMPGREALRPWLHELRGALNGLVGWATVFTVKRDLATRDRAAEKVRACEADVARLLANPPR
jgi:hypothetical protein